MVQKVKAIFEFCFQVGDIVTVINRDDAGWWEGELNGQRGLFPSNYVEPVSEGAVSLTAVPASTEGEPPASTSAEGVPSKAPVAAPPAAPAAVAAPVSTSASASSSSVASNAEAVRGAPPATAPFSLKAVTAKQPIVGVNATPIAASSAKLALVPSTAVSSSSPSVVANVPKLRESRTKYGPWSSNMAFYSAFNSIAFGLLGFIWYGEGEADDIITSHVTLYCSIYSCCVGVVVLFYEHFFGRSRTSNPFPLRGLVYLLLSLFMFISWPTLLPAFFLFFTGAVNFVATAMGEVYDAPAKSTAPASKPAAERKADGIIGAIKIYFASLRQQNKVGETIFFLGYLAGNIVLFIMTLTTWINKVHDAKVASNDSKLLTPSGWAPWAKAFGALLDLNCALILLPVLRTILRYLYNRSTADQGCLSTLLRAILYIVPLDKSLKFHKLIAGVILGATVGHTVMHYINFAVRPQPVLTLFYGAWPLISGGLVCITMFFIYTAAFENTKRGQFEIFWYAHHWFILFFLFLFVHGHHGLNPGYWRYIIGPGALYLLERSLRVYRASQPVVVLSATLMNDVFSLEFAKEGLFASAYREGQYIFLNSPSISSVQWHPFTISSAPEEKTVTVHIRVCGEGSWTKELCTYISAMGPAGKSFFLLDRQGSEGKMAGKILGPDGKPMLCIDGPHSAPTQHVTEYSAAMIIGAGIGATPVSATLRSIVFHRWKYFIGQTFPDHAYFMWVCAHRDIDAFRWLIRNIKDAQDEVVHMRANSAEQMASKTFEFHIWVTSVPKGQKPLDVIVGEEDQIGFWGVPREDKHVDKVRAGWDEADLYKAMKCPSPHMQLGDVHVHDGRPQWGPRFLDVSSRHPSGNVGVTFCGNATIGSDLKKQCFLVNQNRTEGFFKLHKENF